MNQVAIRLARPDEMEQIFRLRFQIFCQEMKFADPNQFPDGLETDSYDSRSDHVLIFKGDEIAAYIRLILPRQGEKFLIEEAVNLPDTFDRNSAIEVSRGLVMPIGRHNGFKEFAMQASVYFCKERGYKFLLSFSNKTMFDSWQRRGYNFHYIGQPINYHGYDTWPLIILP